MTNRIRVLLAEATLEGGKWSSENKTIEELLNVMSESDEFAPWTSDPQPQRNLARRIAEALGGEVLELDPEEHGEEGRIY